MFQIKTEISFVGWMNMRGIAETTAAFTLYSFQRISCSYRTTFPEELNVYLTSTCCCILPVLFPRVSRLKAEKQRCKIQPAAPRRYDVADCQVMHVRWQERHLRP